MGPFQKWTTGEWTAVVGTGIAVLGFLSVVGRRIWKRVQAVARIFGLAAKVQALDGRLRTVEDNAPRDMESLRLELMTAIEQVERNTGLAIIEHQRRAEEALNGVKGEIRTFSERVATKEDLREVRESLDALTRGLALRNLHS